MAVPISIDSFRELDLNVDPVTDQPVKDLLADQRHDKKTKKR